MPSQKVLDAKKAKVEELAEKFKTAKMILLTEYRGLSVSDDTKLRATLREAQNEYMVVKNSTISYALKEAGIEGIEGTLEGPTAVVVSYEDYVAPAKTINDYMKDNDFYKIKMGIMDGKVIDTKEVKKLANLPSKDTLYAMLATSLLGNIRNLAIVLNQVKEKQEENA